MILRSFPVNLTATMLIGTVKTKQVDLQGISLTKEQVEAADHLVNVRNGVAHMPIGYGKTMIYELFPLVMKEVRFSEQVNVRFEDKSRVGWDNSYGFFFIRKVIYNVTRIAIHTPNARTHTWIVNRPSIEIYVQQPGKCRSQKFCLTQKSEKMSTKGNLLSHMSNCILSCFIFCLILLPSMV